MVMGYLPLLAVAMMHRAPSDVSLTETSSVERLLADISQQTGVSYTAAEPIGKEILICSVSHVPVGDLTRRIAWATYGRWQKTTLGWKLVNDEIQCRAAEQHYMEWQSREAAVAIGRLRAQIQRNHLPAPRLGYGAAPETPRAIDFALASALGDIKAADIVCTSLARFATFSDQPTSLELSFNDNGGRILDAYNAAAQPPGVSPEAAHAILTCRYLFETLTANLFLFDADGRLFDAIHSEVPLHDATSPRPTELADTIPDSMTVSLSDASRFYLRLANRDLSDSDRDEIIVRLRHPETYEPLAGFTSDVWKSVATWQKRNLLANVDDAYLTPIWAYGNPKLREAFRTAGGYNAELVADWLIARPSLPNPFWRHRLARAELGELLSSGAESGLAAFVLRAKFAAACEVTPDPFQMEQILGFARRRDIDDYARDWWRARLVGALSPQSRDDLDAGRPVLFADLTDHAREALEVLYTLDDNPEGRFDRRPHGKYPNGLSDRGFLSVRKETNLHYLTQLDNPRETRVFNDTRALSRYLDGLAQNHPEALPKLSIWEKANIHRALSAQVLPDDSLELGQFDDVEDGRKYTWDTAPDDLRQRIVITSTGRG